MKRLEQKNFLAGHYTKGHDIFSTDAACILTEINEDRRTSMLYQPQNNVFNLTRTFEQMKKDKN
jgi:hypothetical protein